jgi:hypothetical protein
MNSAIISFTENMSVTLSMGVKPFSESTGVWPHMTLSSFGNAKMSLLATNTSSYGGCSSGAGLMISSKTASFLR